MAVISRSQLVKELEPGLHALFGLEYKRWEREHAGHVRKRCSSGSLTWSATLQKMQSRRYVPLRPTIQCCRISCFVRQLMSMGRSLTGFLSVRTIRRGQWGDMGKPSWLRSTFSSRMLTLSPARRVYLKPVVTRTRGGFL